jgi:hypothetical protein
MARFEQVSLDMIGRLLVAVELGIGAGERGLGVLRPGDWLLSSKHTQSKVGSPGRMNQVLRRNLLMPNCFGSPGNARAS